MYQAGIVDYYSQSYYEDERLGAGTGRFEYARTQEIIRRYLPADGALTILDVGGATGAYSFWLAGLGHGVHLIDMVPHHVEIARQRSEAGPVRLKSAEVGDARSLAYPDGCADMVLLMGPLYHLVERAERLAALQEGCRVLRPGGRMFCSAISRYASMLSGFSARLLDDPEFEGIVDRDLRDGQHRNPSPGKDYFTTAYFHQPAGLRAEIAGAGLACEKVVGVEGPWCVMSELNGWLDEQGRYYDLALKYARAIEEEESLLGASFHLLGVARKP